MTGITNHTRVLHRDTDDEKTRGAGLDSETAHTRRQNVVVGEELLDAVERVSRVELDRARRLDEERVAHEVAATSESRPLALNWA